MSNDVPKTPGDVGVRILTEDLTDEHPQVTFKTEERAKPPEHADLFDAHSASDNTNSKTSFDVEGAYNESSIQLGTIVTDKRKNRQSFGSMLHSAFDEWLSTTRKKMKDTVDQHEFLKPKEVPKIEVAELRKDVIQEAAQYAKQAPRDDHAIVIEKIRTLAHDAEQVTGKPFLFKPPTKTHAQSSWSHERETTPATPASAKHEEEKVVPIIQKERLVSVPPTETAGHGHLPLAAYAEHFPFSEKGHAPQPIPAFTVSPVAKELSPKTTPPRVRSVAIPHPTHESQRADLRSLLAHSMTPRSEVPREQKGLPVAPYLPPENNVRAPKHKEPLPTLPPIPVPALDKIREEKPPLVLTPAKPAPPPPTKRPAPSIPSRTLLVTSIIVIGASLGIFTAFEVTQKVMTPSSEGPTATSLLAPAFLTTDVQIPIPLPATRNELLGTLKTEIERAQGGVVQLYPVVTTESGSTPASTDEIMEVLSPHAPGSFLRSLSDELMVGTVLTQEPQPYLVMRSSNFDVAFAGMLEWERDMSSDLAPLFGPLVIATLPPQGSGSSGAHFIDALESNRSIRILYDENGNERIVYAFVNDDLIIITTTTEALATLVERMP